MDEHMVHLLTQPVVASLLLALGVMGLRAEAPRPGFGKAGVAGLLALVLLFGPHFLVGKATLGELLLVVLGVGLVGARSLVVPGFRALGLLGGALALVGLWLSLVDPGPTVGDFARAGLVLGAAALLSEAAARAFAGPRYISPRAIFRRTVWRIPPFR